MRALIGVLGSLAFLAGATPAHAAAPPALIHDVNILTLDERGTIANASLLLRDGKIERIIKPGEPLPAGVERIEGAGRYLIPGLVDAHTHFEATNEFASFLAYGVTSVFALGAQSDEQVPEIVAAMKAQSQGKLVGAHLYSTGPSVPVHHDLKSVAEVAPFMGALQRDGFGYIKVYNKIPKDVFDAIVAQARQRAMGVFGHLPRQFPAQYSLSHGLNVVAHMEEFFFAPFSADVTDSALATLSPDWQPDLALADSLLETAKANEVAIIPNLVASRNFRDLWVDEDQAFALPDARYIDPETIGEWRKYNYSHRNLPAHRHSAKRSNIPTSGR
jgi:hypothetical protein